jgi:hypothetical protein
MVMSVDSISCPDRFGNGQGFGSHLRQLRYGASLQGPPRLGVASPHERRRRIVFDVDRSRNRITPSASLLFRRTSRPRFASLAFVVAMTTRLC